jgi:hypothetical protein
MTASGEDSAITASSGDELGRIPFRVHIGVTGHRDLEPSSQLSRAILERLRFIAARFPSTASTPVSFVVLSALADGADQIVADEARVLYSQVELFAILPFAAEEYRTKLKQRRSFDKLAKNANCVVLPRSASDEEAYERAGHFVVDHCDVLVAVWDGYPPGGRGGTAEIVEYANDQGVPVLVVTPSARTEHPDRHPRRNTDDARSKVRIGPAEAAFVHIDRYNSQSSDKPDFRRQLDDEHRELLKPLRSSPLHWHGLTVAQWALPHMVRADRLALRSQRDYYWASNFLYFMAASSVTAIAVQIAFKTPPWTGIFEILALLLLGLVYAIGNRLELQERWLGYRSLAEAFRSALFITVAAMGEPHRGSHESDDSPALRPWYQRAFSQAWRNRPRLGVQDCSAADLRSFLVRGWVERQISYQRQTAEKMRKKKATLGFLISGLFSLTLVAAILHITGALGGGWSQVLVFVAIAAPAWGAAVTGIRDVRQYRHHEDRYLRAADRLDELARDLEAQPTIHAVWQLAREAQEIIQTENEGWSGVLEFQQLELVL